MRLFFFLALGPFEVVAEERNLLPEDEVAFVRPDKVAIYQGTGAGFHREQCFFLANSLLKLPGGNALVVTREEGSHEAR